MAKTAEEKRAYMKTWRAANREKIHQDNATWRAANRERRLAYLRDYKQAHLEQHRLLQAKYYAANPEHHRALGRRSHAANRDKRLARYQEQRAERLLAMKAYRKRHPETHRAAERRRRARMAQVAINDLTTAQWLEIQRAFHHRCAYCRKHLPNTLTQDHLTPLSKGGNHTASNVVPACGPCNARKKDRSVLVPVQPLLLTCA